MAKDPFLQKNGALEFAVSVTVAAPERTDLGAEEPGDQVAQRPIRDGNTGQHLVVLAVCIEFASPT